MTFSRYFIPCAKIEIADGTVIENLDGNGIRIDWSIERDNTNNQDFGEITIYNLSPTTYGAIYDSWKSANGSRYLVILSIGWDRVTSKVFVGDIWDIAPDIKTPTDVMTRIKVGDGVKPSRGGVVGSNFHNVNISTLMQFLVELPASSSDVGGGGLGLIYPKESSDLIKQAASELTGVPSFGNIPAGLDTRETVNNIMDTIGLEWRVHNGEFIAMRDGVINRSRIIIQPKSGLLEYNRLNDGNVEITALANPEIQPGLQITVADDDGNPYGEKAHRVEMVHFEGDTSDNSIMNVVARKARLI